MHRIIAIDPGTANTGLVYMDESRVLCVKTLTHVETVKQDQDALMRRAETIAAAVDDWMADKPHEAVVIEGFMTYTGIGGGYVFQTPYLCGYIHAVLANENLIIQTSRQVLNPRTKGNCRAVKDAVAAGREVMPGALMCKNDHLRSALAHGVYYLTGCK